jgi:release factor glutamine methyltransferase
MNDLNASRTIASVNSAERPPVLHDPVITPLPGEPLSGARLSAWRRALRKFIHFFSYHLILKRNRNTTVRVAGLKLTVQPTVFHPSYFLTSPFFAEFIGTLDLAGKRVVDVGTGTGILALSAARAGARRVLALDVNPQAVETAAINAQVNGVADRFAAKWSDLLSAVPRDETFDVIISSPPSFPGEPRDLADRAWHAGSDYRDIAALFDQARERLAPEGRMYVLLSSDSDRELFGQLIARAHFRARLAAERSILIESLLIYELSAA